MALRGPWFGVLFASTVLAFVACSSDDGPPPVDQNGTVGGRVLLTQDGPLVGAQVSVDLLEYQGATPVVRRHVGDLTTDDTGHFQILTGQDSGYFLVTTRGGSFVDYATGQSVVLDASDTLTALLYTDPLEDLTTGLVTPITHLAHRLIVARTTAGVDRSLVDSHTLVTAHLDQHFGGLAWERIVPASLATAATSPTAEVRAAFVLAAWSMVARDVAAAAGSSVQEVNPFTLAIDLGEDLGNPPFDGDDGNVRTGGLQLGACPPLGACVPSGGTCDLGACRAPCDAYAGTPRTTLAAAVTALVNDGGPDGRNQTGLTVADTLSFARALATNPDAILFGDACVDELDRVAPTLLWGATPLDGALVRGVATWTVHADDNVDSAPIVTWGGGLPDANGAPDDAITSIDTALLSDRAYEVTATATDIAGNRTTETRTVTSDNTAPVLTVDDAGFLPDGATWWTAEAAPVLTGMVADDHGPMTVEARIGGALVASAVVASGAWQLTIPAGLITEVGSTVVVRAVDALGNASAETPDTSPLVRVDTTPPTLTSIAAPFYRETFDTITFPVFAGGPIHTHNTGSAVMLGGTGACAVISKYAYLTATAPAGTEQLSSMTYRNQLKFLVRGSDSGIGLNPATFRYAVTTPSGATVGPFALTATPVAGSPGSYEATATLHRDGAEAILALGVPGAIQESTGAAGARTVYTVTLDVRDRLGQLAAVAPCFDYAPLGPPLQLTPFQGTQTAREAMASATVRPLRGGSFDLPTGAPSSLLNGTAAAGVLEVWVKNRTPDPTYIDITAPAPVGATYTKQITTYLKPGSLVTSSTPTCTIDDKNGINGHGPGGEALCYGSTPAALADTGVGVPTAIAGWQSSLGVYEVTSTNVTSTVMSPCPGCGAAQYEIPAGAHRAIVVGARGIPELRPDVVGPYSEVDGDYTGAIAPGAATIQDCDFWSTVVVDLTERCTRRQNFTQYRSLKRVSVSIPNGRLSVDWTVRAAPTMSTGNQTNGIDARQLSTLFTWDTTEN